MRASTRVVFLIISVCLALSSAVKAQSKYETGQKAWARGDYQQAHDALLDYRVQPYGRRADVDYMLGTSGCRLPHRQEWGHAVLDWMLYAYALTHKSRDLVARERSLCRSANLAQLVQAGIDQIKEEHAAGMTGYGKTFYWAQREEQPVASYPIRRARDMRKEDLRARLVSVDQPDKAISVADKLSPDGRAEVHGRFLIVSENGHSPAQLESIGQTLKRFLRFLATTYDVTPPQHFLTVYLVDSHRAVRQLADRVHGLDVSAATVGYAFVDDASVVAAVPGTAVGTVLHELFHLLVRADFGDIPQWLDEGIASLYEVSGRTEDRYFGLKNWRGRVLNELWHHRPSVEQLIRTEWFLFDDPEQARQIGPGRDLPKDFYDREEGSRQAATMAMSRYFMLYLEQRGELISVFRAIRDRGFADLNGDARDHAIDLVEKTLGRTAEELDAEFVAWFRSGSPESAEAARRPLIEGDSIYTATANVNIRSGPSVQDNALGLLAQGARVAAFGKAGDWIEIRFDDGTVGYISDRYLSTVAGQ